MTATQGTTDHGGGETCEGSASRCLWGLPVLCMCVCFVRCCVAHVLLCMSKILQRAKEMSLHVLRRLLSCEAFSVWVHAVLSSRCVTHFCSYMAQARKRSFKCSLVHQMLRVKLAHERQASMKPQHHKDGTNFCVRPTYGTTFKTGQWHRDQEWHRGQWPAPPASDEQSPEIEEIDWLTDEED